MEEKVSGCFFSEHSVYILFPYFLYSHFPQSHLQRPRKVNLHVLNFKSCLNLVLTFQTQLIGFYALVCLLYFIFWIREVE